MLIRFLAFVMLAGISRAAIVPAASCLQANVATAISDASAGDTVTVPAGNCSWSGLTIAKALKIQGNGIGSTNITLTGSNTITKQAAGVIRITGFTFLKSGGGNESKGFLVNGSWLSAEPVLIYGNAFEIGGSGLFHLVVNGGVIIAENSFTGGWDDSFIQPKNPGDTESWAAADTLGDRDTDGKANHYVEGNTFYGGTNQGIDADDGSRIVYRHNTLTFSSFNTHGRSTSPVGVRHFEVYANEFLNDGSCDEIANQNWAIWIRGGTGFIFGNTIANLAGCWGDKSEVRFTVRGAEDVRPQGSCGSVSYPVPGQIGQSHDGAISTTDPIRWYGNTGSFAVLADWNWGNPCSLTFSDFWQSGRDYIADGAAKAGYAAYTYPHPLLAESSPAPASNRWSGASRSSGGKLK